ncbi:MAG: hypothetical protein NC225_06610 [Clostridium sp.]|nr:hypothetical protein [Clostridium sp.]MCM1399141.1 hypothetical protein [Clostridium sp.]MCM1459533.1 hypothetical protein [Bacteroides sp.]
MANNNNQKPKTKGNYIMGAVFSILGAILFACAFGFGLSNGFKYVFKGATSYEDMIEEQGSLVKGEYVSVDARAVIDWYAETQYKINGIIPAGSKQHCLLWIDDTTFVSLTVKGDENKAKINKLIDQTYKYLNYETDDLPETIHFEGEITSIGSEVSKYYNEILTNWQISGDSDLKVYYLTIDTTSTKLSIVGYGIFALAMIIICIVLCISNIKNAKNFGKVNAYGQNTYTAPDANAYGQNTYTTSDTNTNANMYQQNTYDGNVNADMYSQNTYSDNNGGNTYNPNGYADNTNSYAADDDEKTVLISGMTMGYTEETEKNLKE